MKMSEALNALTPCSVATMIELPAPAPSKSQDNVPVALSNKNTAPFAVAAAPISNNSGLSAPPAVPANPLLTI